MGNSRSIQSVERTFRVIKELCDEYNGLSLTELSARVDLPISTVSRILNTLASDNLIQQNKNSLRYSLGDGFLEISLKFLGGFELRKVAYPHMQKLQSLVSETINLAILEFDEIIYIERVVSSLPLRHSMKIGDRASACSTALGKAMLAFSEEEFVNNVLSKWKEQDFPKTKEQVGRLLEELAQIRLTRISFDDRIHQDHIRCIGSPIFNSENQVIGAISISGPASRMTDQKLPEMAKALIASVNEVSKEIGCKI